MGCVALEAEPIQACLCTTPQGNHNTHRFLVDDRSFLTYDSTMTHDETNIPEQDPLTVGELISLQEAAEYARLSKGSLYNYAVRGRLKAKRVGAQWVTTRAAVDVYLQSRNFENIPIKYRKYS